jgi:hypothetical protein
MEQCEGNYITFALFMLVFADNKNEPLVTNKAYKEDSLAFLHFLFFFLD